MKKLMIASLVSLVCVSAQAQDKSGFYVTGKIGASVVEAGSQKLTVDQHGSLSFGGKSKTVFSGGAAVGYNFIDLYQIPVRIELDYMERAKSKAITDVMPNFSVENKIRLQTFMVNAYYDIATATPLTPYISAGIGYARVKLTTLAADSEKPFDAGANNSNFAWSLGVGAKYAVNQHIDLDLGYRYLDANKADVTHEDVKSQVKAKSNDVMFGVSYRF